MQSAKTFLMFSGKYFGKAEEAIKFYVSLFEGSSVEKIELFQAGDEQGKEGTVKESHFIVAGHHMMAHDSYVDHKFNFTPSISIFVTFDSEAAIAPIFNALKEGGLERLPLGDYGFSKKFGWVEDRFGINWQLSWV